MTEICDKVVMITGASSGIGDATARHLADLGMKVVLGARRTARLEALANDIGPHAVWRPTDVTRLEALLALAALALERVGRVAVLVNNEGIMPTSPPRMGRFACCNRVTRVLSPCGE